MDLVGSVGLSFISAAISCTGAFIDSQLLEQKTDFLYSDFFYTPHVRTPIPKNMYPNLISTRTEPINLEIQFRFIQKIGGA